MTNSVQQVSEDKEQLSQILQDKEYTVYNQQEHGSIWDWLKPLWHKIRKYLPDIHLPKGSGDFITYAVMIVLLAIAGYGIYWFSKQIIRQKRVRSTAYLPAGELSRSYNEYWRQADASRLTRQWREGVRYTYLSLLFYLEAGKALRVEKWKTNWEYRDELEEKEPSLVPVFQESSLVFDRIWYGKEEVTEEQFTRFYQQIAQVIGREEGLGHERAE
ncbi:DUF4129 domain-containing protein [Paenibacillus hexagrammi]|uniref:DUF4129 domain-containing protein n=1 Tax=Paenibacillus hexagrammi TaxID=2908839 RepID=A0ABY3SGQ3_9BACL|nr:DUF4129 domain-containing protein [Paenibacillus sp. YPD9-1]UJF32580.1 DUF4129 domain-containing protein [Paenibacillus sp. YPD9-1]